MTDAETEVIDSTTDTQDDVLIEDTTDVDVDALVEQNKKLFARAKKAEGFTQDSSGNWIKKAKPQAQTITKTEPAANSMSEEVLELRLKGYSREDADFIIRNGGTKALEDKNSLTHIAMKTKKEQERAEIAASQTVDTSSMSDVERKYTQEQMKNMTAQQLAEILPHA